MCGGPFLPSPLPAVTDAADWLPPPTDDAAFLKLGRCGCAEPAREPGVPAFGVERSMLLARAAAVMLEVGMAMCPGAPRRIFLVLGWADPRFCALGFSMLRFVVAPVGVPGPPDARAPPLLRVPRRIMAALAMLGVPPRVLAEVGCRGVLVPVAVAEAGGTRLPGESRRSEGREGSGGIWPSFSSWRSLRS